MNKTEITAAHDVAMLTTPTALEITAQRNAMLLTINNVRTSAGTIRVPDVTFGTAISQRVSGESSRATSPVAVAAKTRSDGDPPNFLNVMA